MRYKFLLILLSVVLSSSMVKAQQEEQKEHQPPQLFVMFHTAGPNWVDSLPFTQQPGLMEHVEYMSTFMAGNKLVMGGPFLDNSGGMMICKAESLEEAQSWAENDPTVKKGMLSVEVRPWLSVMSTVSFPEDEAEEKKED